MIISVLAIAVLNEKLHIVRKTLSIKHANSEQKHLIYVALHTDTR